MKRKVWEPWGETEKDFFTHKEHHALCSAIQGELFVVYGPGFSVLFLLSGRRGERRIGSSQDRKSRQ